MILMANLQDYLTDPDYIGNYTRLLEGQALGVVYIEDASDQAFWELFIEAVFPEKYTFKIASSNGASHTGKRALETMYDSANASAMVAVDSDYDYILSHFNSSHSFNRNPYILHTFAYSRESVQIEKLHLQSFFRRTKYTIPHSVDINAFLTQFSQLAFEGLQNFIIELNKNNRLPLPFHTCFQLSEGNQPISDTLSINHELLPQFEKAIQSYQAQFSHSEDEKEHVSKELETIGITPDNAYRFISGHKLEALVCNLHSQLVGKLKHQEITMMSESGNYQGQAIEERKNQIDRELTKRHQIHTCLTHRGLDKDDEIHQKILKRVRGACREEVSVN